MSVGLGIVGLGTAGVVMLAAALDRSDLRVSAVADTRIDELGFDGHAEIHRHASLQALLADDEVDAVHLATPTPLHREHVEQVLSAGRHVIVEKPVTTDGRTAHELIELASRQDRIVLVGHSESFEPYVRAARDVIASGEIGTPSMIMAEKFTDWMRRPRLPEEWDPAMGGGLIRRQGVHQVDVVRTLVDGGFSVLTASTREDPERHVAGTYCAWLTGAGPLDVFITHDGIGRLSAGAQPPADRHENPSPDGSDEYGAKRQRTATLLQRALRERAAMRIGADDAERVLVMGSDGELTASGRGVAVTTADGRREAELSGYASGRAAVLDELVTAISGDSRVRHSLAWGTENLELCEEIERVAETTRTGERPLSAAR